MFSGQYFEGSGSTNYDLSSDSKKDLEQAIDQLKDNEILPHLVSLRKMIDRHNAYIQKKRNENNVNIFLS